MTANPDAIVIGTGIGGSAAAALLAGRGKTVTVLERNPFVGGRCASYKKEGFVIDVFVHMVGRCEKGPFGEILRRVARPDAVRWWHPSAESRVVLWIDDEPYPHPDPSYSSPEERESVYRAFGFSDKEIEDAFLIYDTIENMPYEKTFELDNTPYTTWLKTFTDSKLLLGLEHQQVLLCSVITPKEASAGEMIRMFANARTDANVGYPIGGCGAIPEALLSVVRDAGGVVRLRTPVSKVLVEQGRAVGVRLEDGEEIRAPLIISNAGIKETMNKYVEKEALSPDYVESVQSLTTGKLVEGTPMGMIYLKLALAAPVIDAPLVFRNVREGTIEGLAELMQGIMEDKPPKDYKGINIFIPVPSNMDPALAPAGKQLVNFYGLAPVHSKNLDAWVDFHLGYLYTLYPEVEKHLMWYDFSTLDRINKCSGRFHPDIIGITQSVGQTGTDRPSPVTPIENLYLVGADVGQDNIGTELAAESALRLEAILDERGAI